jgi:NADPH:quinone reductase-like Zn-dependent oxidoreductase
MKAVICKNFSSINNLTINEIETPKPEDHEVQIYIKYAGVNPVDWKIIEGYLKDMIPHQFPIIPGWDVAGVISAVGKKVKNLKIGDEVYAYCRKDVVHAGSFADYICLPEKSVALKPKTLSLAQASAIPLVALTAWQSLFDFAKLKKGQTILIHAGAGGVGSLAIGLAKNLGAKIYTTASKRNHDYVKKLGADVAIDYREENFVDKIKSLEPNGVDVVLDCVGSQTLEDSFQLVKKNGFLVSIVNNIDESKGKKYGIHTAFAFVAANNKQLQEIGDLIDAEKILSPEIHEYPFSDYMKALQQIKTEHTRGKLVLTVNA